MSPPLLHCQHLDLANLSADQVGALADAIRQLATGTSSSYPSQMLRGRDLGLLRGSGEPRDVALFKSAAAALGARVACLPPGLAEPGATLDLAHAAHVIGRLYDALVCIGRAGERVCRIGELAGVPLIEGFAESRERLERLVDRVAGAVQAEDRQQLPVQAVLLYALA